MTTPKQIVDPDYTIIIDEELINIELDNGDWLDIDFYTARRLCIDLLKATK